VKLKDIRSLLEAEVVGATEAQLETEILSACGSDLMSDVLAFGRPGQILLTGLVNAQSVRTAIISGAKAIVFIRGKRPDSEVLETAKLKNIPILLTRHMMYEACGILYKSGLPASGHVEEGGPQHDQSQGNGFTHTYQIAGGNYHRAGKASTTIMDILKEIGIDAEVVRRAAIASYEAEMNVVMYAEGGEMTIFVSPETIHLLVQDKGPGISDISLAMQEGYSTATPEMREMGFGAGMGLPNIKKNSERFEISSVVGQGTRLDIYFDLRRSESERAGE
jgi:serine/threonine-protein kinase RsbT